MKGQQPLIPTPTLGLPRKPGARWGYRIVEDDYLCAFTLRGQQGRVCFPTGGVSRDDAAKALRRERERIRSQT
jgi:hypothetical protein